MAGSQYRSGVPDNWFVDPVQLGVPGVRRPVEAGDDNPLAWQTDALCSQTVLRDLPHAARAAARADASRLG
jgi:WhiB family redox-sensing transcriptional regulator